MAKGVAEYLTGAGRGGGGPGLGLGAFKKLTVCGDVTHAQQMARAPHVRGVSGGEVLRRHQPFPEKKEHSAFPFFEKWGQSFLKRCMRLSFR